MSTITPMLSALRFDAPARGAGSLLDAQGAFADALGRARTNTSSPEEAARRAAEQLIAGAFLRPLLKRVRESSMAAPPFAPTQGELQFRAIADAQLAQRLVHAAHWPLVERLTQELQHAGGAKAPPQHTQGDAA